MSDTFTIGHCRLYPAATDRAQLDLFTARERAAGAGEIALLTAALEGQGWLTAGQLAPALGWSDRKVRAVASASPAVVSWPGSPGYKLLGACTVEEFARYEAAMASQISRMDERLRRSRRAYHARGHAA